MREQILLLRQAMKNAGVDAYVVPTDDYHGSEYVGDYFKCRRWASGFTGSAGTLVVTENDAALWTDGRYFLQAADELAGSGIELMKSREKGVPTITEWLEEKLVPGQTLGFDGRTMTLRQGRGLAGTAQKKGCAVCWDRDLVGEVWKDRPAFSDEKVWVLDETLTGRSRADKLKFLREKIKENGADEHLLSSLDDIAWLLNLRGADVHCCPVFLSFFLLDSDSAVLYADRSKFSDEILQSLAADGIEVRPYLAVFDDVKTVPEDKTVLLDPRHVSYALAEGIAAHKTEADNPTEAEKAKKTVAERENAKLAHVKDGVALVRFTRWLKENVGKTPLSEISAAEKLEAFRAEEEHYLGPSFEPIFGYGPHGAIVHYSATPETDAPLKPEGLLLFDTGAQFLEGTTDVTRTVALGPVTEEMRRHFTLVLMGHLDLLAAVFRKGCSGTSLDVLARGPLWDEGLDYNHGTGHGVGSLLNVHEGPQRIHYGASSVPAVFEEGMITSDEPGLYLTGRYGIRHESLLLCEKRLENDYGVFFGFTALTMCPFDLDVIDPSLMTDKQKRTLNAYHRTVRETLFPRLADEDRAWLLAATREI